MSSNEFGKILTVDLKNKSFIENPIEIELIKKYLGGPGLAIDYMMREKVFENDPYQEKNPLIFMMGLLTGTAYPCSGFFSVSAKSPLTNIYGEGMSAGFFGAALRPLFNGIIFKSKAESPLYLVIDDDNYELKDATSLWGLDTTETIHYIRSNLGKQFKVACIGPSGEKLIPLASIINDHGRAVGRAGMGAIMGSKNLKAVAVKNTKNVSYKSESKFKKLSRFLFKEFKNSPMAGVMHQIGTNGIEYFMTIADVPHKNWTLGRWAKDRKISGYVVEKKMLVKLTPCYMCPFSCGRTIEVKEGPFKVSNAAGPEYETVAAFGSMCLNSNLESIAYLNDYCNRMGVDTISTGCTIAFAIECYEKGILTQDDIGFPLEWGDPDAIVKLTKLICNKEGIGKVLSQGTRMAAQVLGKKSDELTAEIKGLDAPMHEPRANFALGLQYATSNRGACHLRGFASDFYSGFANFKKYFQIDEDVSIATRSRDDPRFAKHVAIGQNLSEINNALGVCRQTFSSGSQVVENIFDLLLEAIESFTGISFDLSELLKIGERIFNLKRLFNIKCGITKKDDRIPLKLKMPLLKGLAKNKPLKIDLMLEEYYKFRGWDEDGVPTRDKLNELDIVEYL
ncbi:MAG: aldehyde ferredoxin oxidoreductase family protein [Candidatus Helarchaeota archaeon]